MTQENQLAKGRLSPLWIVVIAIIIVVVVGAVYFLTRSGSTGMPKPDTRADQQQAADDALTILRNLAQDNYQLLGFTSPEEAQGATLGMPLDVMFVPLDQLREYSPEQSPDALLSDSRLVLYPVDVNNEVRSSVQVQGSDEGWTPAGFGSTTLIKAVTAISPSQDAFLVQVPSLGLYFVAQREDDSLMLTSLYDEPRFEFSAGRPLDASQVFEAIQSAANELDEEAPM